MIVIRPQGGLCNYLRVIFSYYQLAKVNNMDLVVNWMVTKWCPGYFLDYFEPVPGIIFNKTYNRKETYKNLPIKYITNLPHPDYPPVYQTLKLLPEMNLSIQEKRDILENNYIAVHVRRTDGARNARKNNNYTTDEEFYNFIDNEIDNKKLYIATDNPETYNQFQNKYKKYVKFKYHQVVTTKKDLNVRRTTLKDAIMDLYMCVYSNKFMGSGTSTFSELIRILACKDN